ncbi:hypothetical protein G0U57_011895, partial [Chelydra serpentina]
MDRTYYRFHTLDIRRALAFYTERTRPFRKAPRLFGSMTQCFKGSIISKQRLSKWTSDSRVLCN